MRTPTLTTLATVLALGASSILGGGASAQQQQKPMECTKVVDPKAADGGYNRVGVRRPKVEIAQPGGAKARVTEMTVQVALPVDAARTDASLEEPKVVEIQDCPKSKLGFPTTFILKVDQLETYDATEIVLPATTPVGTKFQSCSMAGGCFVGEFKGFDTWVNLTPQGATATAKVKGTYKD